MWDNQIPSHGNAPVFYRWNVTTFFILRLDNTDSDFRSTNISRLAERDVNIMGNDMAINSPKLQDV